MEQPDVLETIEFEDTQHSISIEDFDLEGITIENNEIRTEENTKELEQNIVSKILGLFWGITKYTATSTCIFGLLLVGTNYSAYYNIAQSYFAKDALEQKETSLIESVNASELAQRLEEKEQKEEDIKKNEEAAQYEKLSKFSIKNIVRKSNQEDVGLDIEMTPYENRIVIPKIGKNIPLVDIENKTVDGENELHNIFMKELEKGVIRYPGSATPGNHGNAFIFGHSSNFPWIDGDYNDVFSLLDKVVYDDEIVVYYGQKKYKYAIKEKHVIKPGDVDILKRNKDKSEITLMTCWPVGTTLNRLVVIGELIEDTK